MVILRPKHNYTALLLEKWTILFLFTQKNLPQSTLVCFISVSTVKVVFLELLEKSNINSV